MKFYSICSSAGLYCIWHQHISNGLAYLQIMAMQYARCFVGYTYLDGFPILYITDTIIIMSCSCLCQEITCKFNDRTIAA